MLCTYRLDDHQCAYKCGSSRARLSCHFRRANLRSVSLLRLRIGSPRCEWIKKLIDTFYQFIVLNFATLRVDQEIN